MGCRACPPGGYCATCRWYAEQAKVVLTDMAQHTLPVPLAMMREATSPVRREESDRGKGKGRTSDSGAKQRHKRPDGYASAVEARYAEVLEQEWRDGEIAAWWYEAIKLRLAAKCFFTPDFLVRSHDGKLVFHEVKGFWRDDARVKIKVAAHQYPCFQFVAVQYNKGLWEYEMF